jgi:hypothetical protein
MKIAFQISRRPTTSTTTTWIHWFVVSKSLRQAQGRVIGHPFPSYCELHQGRYGGRDMTEEIEKECVGECLLGCVRELAKRRRKRKRFAQDSFDHVQITNCPQACMSSDGGSGQY